MLVVVLLALRRARVTNPGAEFEHFAQDLLVGAGPPHRQLARRLAYVGTIEARADAFPHVHLLRGASVGAAQAHAGAVHQVMRCIAERLVDVSLHIGVQAIILRMDMVGSS